MNNKFKFKILREEVETEDIYEDKTHENIKNSLLKLIKNENEGLTVGLSGQWGSGKSTIINLLKKEKDFLFFYFDAWAHEGDPLRRIFLESFINCVKETESDINVKKLEEKRVIISKEKRTKITEIKRTTTKFGLLLAIATFTFAIGVAILSSINYDNLTFHQTDSINLAVYIGAIFSLSPFIVALKNYCEIKKNGKKVEDLNNWAFLQNNSDETIIEDVIGEDERSSIEFEKYFQEILEIISADSKKIIIVLDNLDRVEAEVSLKIWSTLQTFIQYKNPTSKNYKIFKNIFTLIPYDEDSLIKIWDKHNLSEDEMTDINFAKSFFDKSFQIRIDVPKPIVSNWLNFMDKMIQKAFPNWPEEDKKTIKEVIEKTRKNIIDNPKPREIKTYLNQIGFLRNHYSEDISTKSIAIYSFKRYLLGQSNDNITNHLLKIKTSQTEVLKDFNMLEEDTVQEISAIIYGVNKDKGAQMLLTPKIIDALNNNKPDILKEIIQNHENVFWSIFKKIITDTSDLKNFLRYSTPINKFFEEINDDLDLYYIKLLERYIHKEINRNYEMDNNFSEEIKSSSDLLIKYEKTNTLHKLWEFYIQVYIHNEINSSIIEEDKNKNFIDTLHYINRKNKTEPQKMPLDIRFDSWKSLNNQKDFSEIIQLIPPSQKLVSQISEGIKTGYEINNEDYSLIANCIKTDVNTDLIFDNLKEHFKWNNGTQSGNVFNSKSIKLFESLFYKSQKERDYSVFFKSSELYSVSLFVAQENENIIKMMATMCAIFFKDSILNIEIDLYNSYSEAFILNIKKYWQTFDANNAVYTYEKFAENDFLKNIWCFCKDENNILCYEIINLAINNEHDEMFKVDNPLEIILEISKKQIEHFNISEVIKKFHANSTLEEEILNMNTLQLDINNYMIYEILKSINSKKIYKKVEGELEHLSDDVIKNSIYTNDYLFHILLEVKKNNNDFFLMDNGILYEFAKSISLEEHNFTEWQEKNWTKIVQLLNETYFENFKDRITKLIIDKKDSLKDIFFISNKEFINHELFIELTNKEVKQLKLYIQETLENPQTRKLNYIEYLLDLDSNKEIRFGRDFKTIIAKNIKKNLVSPEEDTRRVTNKIAKRFSIKID